MQDQSAHLSETIGWAKSLMSVFKVLNGYGMNRSRKKFWRIESMGFPLAIMKLKGSHL
jgi:hypothetical protein